MRELIIVIVTPADDINVYTRFTGQPASRALEDILRRDEGFLFDHPFLPEVTHSGHDEAAAMQELQHLALSQNYLVKVVDSQATIPQSCGLVV